MQGVDLLRLLERGGKDPARLVFEDELTGLFNRRFLFHYFEDEVDWQREPPGSLPLLMLDLDEFKSINDGYGHPVGDQALIWVAAQLREAAGENGLPIRYAGDEFMLLLPDCSKGEARERAEWLQQQLRTNPLPLESRQLTLRVSIGLAAFPEDARSGKGLVQQADTALYQAKRGGGAQVADIDDVDLGAVTTKAGLTQLDEAGVVGRRPQLRRVDDGIEALARRESRLLVLRGAPGIGKTTFLETVRTQLAARPDSRVLQVTGRSAEMFRPYYLAVDVLSALLRSEPDGGRSALEALGVSDAERLFSVIEQGDSGAPNEPAKREAIFQSVVRLLARVLAGQPLVLLVDDAHLADEATLLLLRVLVESEGVSLLVCAAAPKLEGGDATPLERFLDTHQGSLPLEQVELGPLTAADVGDHLRAIFPQVAIPEGFERELAEATQGNALFLGEILRKLVQDGKIRLRAHQWVIDPLEDGYLPRSLEDIVREKIAALDEEGRDLLGHASVLGESLPVSELVGGSECPEGRVLEFVDRAAALGLVTTEFDRDDETVRFLGKRVLEIAYGSLDPERREVLHERVGDYHESIYKSQSLLPPASILAYHFKRSASQEKSRYYVELQARHSRAIFDPEEAAHYSAELEDDAYTGPPLAVESAAAVPGLLRALLTAVRKVKLYPSSSEALRVAFGQVEAALAPILAKNELLDVHCVDDELRVNGEPLSVGDLRLVASGLGDLLRRLELRGLSLHRGIAPGEIQTLVRAFGETRPEAIDPRFWERFGAEQGLAHVNLKQLRYKAVTGSSAEPASATTRDPDAAGVREVVRALVALGRGVLLYPVQSQVITGTIERIDEALTGLLAEHETLSLAVADDAVLVDGMPSEASRFDRLTAELLELFEAVGLDSLHFRRGVLRAELEALVVGLREFPRDCGDEDFWPAFAEGRGLTRIAFNASRYATGVASTLVEVRVPPTGAEAPGALPEPEPARPEETLDELLPELPGRVRERLLANDAAGLEQLAARVFADFERLETLRREKILVSWRAAGLSLEIGLQRDLAAALAPPLLAALVAERDPGVLREAAALLHPLTETLIQLREYRLAASIVSGLAARRRALLGESDAGTARVVAALVRRPMRASQDLLRVDLGAEGEPQQGALLLVECLAEAAVPLLVEVITRAEEPRTRQLAARLLERCGAAGGQALRAALTGSVRPEQRVRILEVFDSVTPGLGTELAAMLSDEHPEVRQAALALAARVKDARVLDLIIAQAQRVEASLAVPAIEALGGIAVRGVAAALGEILDRAGDLDRAIACCQALGKLADPDGVGALVRALERRERISRRFYWSTAVRGTAAFALSRAETAEARRQLAAFADDPDPVVARVAHRVVGADP